MFYKVNLEKSIKYFDSSLIALVLSIVALPPLWYISQGNILWVISSTIVWGVGVFTIFHPSIKFLFPFLLTKMGSFALTFILAIITILLNSLIIAIFLPVENMEIVMNNVFFDTSIGTIALFVWFYIIIAEATVSNINININYILYQQKKLLREIFTLSEYYLEILFLSVLPVAVIFWTDITYSFRILLGILSIGIGTAIFISKIDIDKIEQRVLVSTLSVIAVLLINSAVITLLGIDRVPTRETIQTKSIADQSFLLSNNRDNSISVYQIVASIPQIGLNLGHKVATIPDREITIEATKSQYTIYDQYNDKVLLTLDR